MLTPCLIMIHLSKLRNKHWYSTITSTTLFGFILHNLFFYFHFTSKGEEGTLRKCPRNVCFGPGHSNFQCYKILLLVVDVWGPVSPLEPLLPYSEQEVLPLVRV